MTAPRLSLGFGMLGWGAFLLLFAAALVIAMGLPAGPVWIAGGIVAILFAYNYSYVTYGILVFLTPLLGLMVSLPTGRLAIGERAFGGAIDVQVAELAALALVAAWALKVFRLWIKRRDINWKPWLPLAWPMLAIVAAQLLSSFSSLQPDPVLVAKYALRPVFWTYLVYVVLTANFVRSPRRLRMTLAILAFTGVAAALMGFVSLFTGASPDQLLRRAHPLSIFGVMPLGDNHNLLAEWLAFTAPVTLALAVILGAEHRARRLLLAAAGFQVLIALLTFARTVWIVLAFEAALILWWVWREQLRRWLPSLILAAVLLLPLGVVMAAFSSTPTVQSSTSTRFMLTEIALNLWRASPWIGVGAGTFVDRVSDIRVFTLEYGGAVDAHGFGQKLLAETGLLGVLAAAWFIWSVAAFVRARLPSFVQHLRERQIVLLLAATAAGAFVYQLFNTNYWTGKLWLPVGLLLAATRALAPRNIDNE